VSRLSVTPHWLIQYAYLSASDRITKGKKIASLRIRNQYLLGILSVITELGARDVSAKLVVEAWKAKGRVCDEQFFLHFDALCNYKFLVLTCTEQKLLDIEKLLEFSAEQDNLVTITHEGQAFFERYGG